MPEKEKKDRGTPDAVLYPESYKSSAMRMALKGDDRQLLPGEAPRLKMRGIQDRLATILGGQAWHTDAGGGWHLASLEPHPSLLHPQDHPTLPKQPKYDWEDQDDGTKHGWLKPDEPEEDEAPAPKAIRKHVEGKGDPPPKHREPAKLPEGPKH